VETEEGGGRWGMPGIRRGCPPGGAGPVAGYDLSRSVCAAFQPGRGQDTSNLAMDSLDLPVMLARARSPSAASAWAGPAGGVRGLQQPHCEEEAQDRE